MVSSICQAKDPRTCPYHGAVLRMNEAMYAKPTNFNAYYEARKEVEAQEKQGWDESQLREALKLTDINLPPVVAPVPLAADDTPTPPLVLDNYSEAAQQGILLDKIAVRMYQDEEVVEFKLHKPGDYDTFPLEPYNIRIQTNEPLTANEVKHLAQLMGYSYRKTIAGESLGEPYQDTPYSFVMFADTTKSRRDDLGMAIEEFEKDFPETVEDGSPVRTTNRAGEGTKGTRLVNPFDKKVELNFYYDY